MSAAAFAARRKRRPMVQAEAARQLRRATLGVQLSEISAAAGQRLDQWVDAQLAIPYTPLQATNTRASRRLPGFPTAPVLSEFGTVLNQYWTWKFSQPEKLRTRLTYALTEYFSVGTALANPVAYADFFDLLESQVHSGTFRSLIAAVTRTQLMSTWLTYFQNERTNGVRQPDENYAREVMQLYTIGLWELNLDGSRKTTGQLEVTDPRYVLNGTADVPTYGQADITNVARVFTGLTPTFSWDGGATIENGDNSFMAFPPGAEQWRDALGNTSWRVPLVYAASRHESTLPKQALQGRINIAVGVGGDASLNTTLDALVAHPSTAPYFATRMIRLLVTSNPSPAYIARVASVFLNDGTGQVGNLRAVFRAIVLDQDAQAPASRGLTSRVPSNEEQRFGVVYAHAPALTVDGAPVAEGTGAAPGSATLVGSIPGISYPNPYGFGQNPSVFGRWPSEYRAAGTVFSAGLVSPELKTLAEVEVSELYSDSLLWERIRNMATPADLADCATTGNNAALVARLSDRFTGGSAPQTYLNALVACFSTVENDTDEFLRFKYGSTVAALFLSPWGIKRF